MTLSDRIHVEATRRLGALAPDFLGKVSRLSLPMLDGDEWENDRERVHLALIDIVESDPSKLDYHLQVARTDWRDTLALGQRISATPK